MPSVDVDTMFEKKKVMQGSESISESLFRNPVNVFKFARCRKIRILIAFFR